MLLRRLLVASVLTGCSGTVDDAGAAAEAADTGAAEETSAAADTSSVADTGVSADNGVEAGDPVDAPADVAPETPSCPPTLKPGAEYKVAVDAFTGNEATTTPKTDANDGKSGDNPVFRRNNVARGHVFGEAYWYTSKHQEAGEPNPKGDQWVDYAVPFSKIGAGRYRVFMKYRAGENRAPYPAKYVIEHVGGPTTVTRDQNIGGMVVTEFELGTFAFGCTGSVRGIDTGADSISFGAARFVYVGP